MKTFDDMAFKSHKCSAVDDDDDDDDDDGAVRSPHVQRAGYPNSNLLLHFHDDWTNDADKTRANIYPNSFIGKQIRPCNATFVSSSKPSSANRFDTVVRSCFFFIFGV